MQQVNLIVTGRVQGVFYRATCQEIALGLGLKGWVRNLPTGQVEVLVQGEKDKIEKLIKWCKKGPPSAVVHDIKVEWENAVEKFNMFSVA